MQYFDNSSSSSIVVVRLWNSFSIYFHFDKNKSFFSFLSSWIQSKSPCYCQGKWMNGCVLVLIYSVIMSCSQYWGMGCSYAYHSSSPLYYKGTDGNIQYKSRRRAKRNILFTQFPDGEKQLCLPYFSEFSSKVFKYIKCKIYGWKGNREELSYT